MALSIHVAFYLLCAAIALGGVLALPYLHVAVKPLPRPLRVAHGGVGAGGLAVLVLALRHGLPQSAMGTAGFGPAAAGFLALALLLGLAIALLRRRPPGAVVAIHASLAIAGFVVLWTLASLG